MITVVAMGTGAQKACEDKINSLGASLVQINAGQDEPRRGDRQDRAALLVADYEALRRDATTLSEVVPELQKNQQVQLVGTNINTSIVGTTANYPKARATTSPTHGRMPSPTAMTPRGSSTPWSAPTCRRC